jgi:hypothetical protein
MTRLMPLETAGKPLAPHGGFSHRVLLALQALGVIEPELSLSQASDWLSARDWPRSGLESVSWRIRWTPKDCERQHQAAKQLLADIDPSDEMLEVLLDIWEDLGTAEAVQYAGWTLAKYGYNPQWGVSAFDAIARALQAFSVSQVMYFIQLAARTVVTTHQQAGAGNSHLDNVFVSSIGSFSRRAATEGWDVKGVARPTDLPLSVISSIFAHEVTRLDDEYLTVRPCAEALVRALLRGRTVH